MKNNLSSLYPTISDICALMKELGYKWSNETQVYYDYDFNIISDKSAHRIYNRLLGKNPYSTVSKINIIENNKC